MVPSFEYNSLSFIDRRNICVINNERTLTKFSKGYGFDHLAHSFYYNHFNSSFGIQQMNDKDIENNATDNNCDINKGWAMALLDQRASGEWYSVLMEHLEKYKTLY